MNLENHSLRSETNTRDFTLMSEQRDWCNHQKHYKFLKYFPKRWTFFYSKFQYLLVQLAKSADPLVQNVFKSRYLLESATALGITMSLSESLLLSNVTRVRHLILRRILTTSAALNKLARCVLYRSYECECTRFLFKLIQYVTQHVSLPNLRVPLHYLDRFWTKSSVISIVIL